ncbi:hypothetical protein BGZ83_010126 [Gryganskiella cystojenkinii]|nr:hypothetical protein BGZ83_010126 [Gryganskiella cystojenkinii]
MNHSEPVYYEGHHDQFDDLPLDNDEEYREDMFLRQHYSRPMVGGLGLVHDDDDSDDDGSFSYIRNHQGRHDFHEGDDDIEEEDEDEYDEVDMDQHSIHLLSGSLSVRSPFLDAIREEEDEEPVFTKPSSYPSLGSGRYLNRRSGEGFGAWSARNSPLGVTKEDQHAADDQQQANYNNSNQSEGSKPRGPRPPIMLGKPRSSTTSSSSSPLAKVTNGFEIPSTSAEQNTGVRDTQDSSESSIQDLEVKRVLEGAAALASSNSSLAAAATADDDRDELATTTKSTDSTPLPSVFSPNTVSLSANHHGTSTEIDSSDPAVSFGHDTQKSIDDFFGMVKSDLDKRIQEAIQEVEQKFLQRVQRLEEHTAVLAGTPEDLAAGGGTASIKSGSLMESLTRPLPAHQNPGGSLALRKEILSHVTEKVGDLDLRVNQMEVLVSYKLVDIESKVQDLHGAHNSIAQKVHQVAQSHRSNMQGLRAGELVGHDTIRAEEQRVANAIKPYREIDAEGRGASAYLQELGNEGTVSLKRNNTLIADQSSAIVELRNELHSLGMQYQELNDGLLTDLMSQMRDAKLILFQTVDEVDGRISKRVDRIEAEMHSKLLSEIEGRVAERVRAMEQTSSRLERCFDKMEGRLGALETVLASKRPRPESMYQLLQQQLQQQQQQEEESGIAPHAGTFAGFSSSPSSSDHRSVTSSNLFSAPDSPATAYTRPRRRTLAENGYAPYDSSTIRQDSGDEQLMMLETASTQTTLKRGNGSSDDSLVHYQPYNPANHPMVASPLEGFVSPTQGQPVWSPLRGASAPTVPQALSSGGSSNSNSNSNSSAVVASPLERSTVIGNRMGTIHPEYQPRTSYIPATPSTPVKDRIQNSGVLSSSPMTGSGNQQSSLGQGQGSRVRRVSLPSFDANSLSALKSVKASAAAASETPASTSIVTTTTTTTTMTAQTNSSRTSGLPAGGNVSVKSTSSLLTAKLNAASSGLSSGDSPTSPSSSHGSASGGPTTAVTSTMQRAMTFDTLHTQASTTSTITKTVKTPVQGPSSYRELLHFWKAGGSGSGNGGSNGGQP